MHSFAHHHHSEALAGSTRGVVTNLGWRYEPLGVVNTILLGGKLQALRQRTADLAQLQPGEAVLDVGCDTVEPRPFALPYVRLACAVGRKENEP
jgi:hypothetical protein